MKDTRITVLGITLAVASVVSIQPRVAGACSFVGSEPHVLDADEQMVDTAAPDTPEIIEVEMIRRPMASGCATETNSCAGAGSLGIAISAADDRTPPETMGYAITLAEGELPEGLVLPDEPVRAMDEFIWLNFSDRDQPLDFVLEVRAVDLAGNTGDPVAVEISDGAGGCSTGGGGFTMAMLVLCALALVGLRRHTGVATRLSR